MFLTAQDLGANITRASKASTRKTSMAARYDRTILIWKGMLKTVWHNTVFMWRNRGFPATALVIFIGLLRLKKRSTEKKTPRERLLKGDRSRQIRKFTHVQIYILAKFYSIILCFATKKTEIFRAWFLTFPSVKFPKIFWTVKHICVVKSRPVVDQIWDGRRNNKIANSEE